MAPCSKLMKFLKVAAKKSALFWTVIVGRMLGTNLVKQCRHLGSYDSRVVCHGRYTCCYRISVETVNKAKYFEQISQKYLEKKY